MEAITQEEKKRIFGEDKEGCDMLVGVDTFRKIVFLKSVSQKAYDAFGYKEEEVIGRQATDFLVGAENVTGIQYFGRLYASESAFRSIRKAKGKDGREIILESYLVPMYDTEGKFTGHVGMEFIKDVLSEEN